MFMAPKQDTQGAMLRACWPGTLPLEDERALSVLSEEFVRLRDVSAVFEYERDVDRLDFPTQAEVSLVLSNNGVGTW